MERLTRVPTWIGIDPALTEETVTDSGCVLRPARASRLEFRDETFDVALFANVFEHIPPDERDVSLREIYRVLKPGGVVVGQLRTPSSRSNLTAGSRSWVAAEQVATPILEVGAGQLGP
jgi:ubiquinone/menaquinone biosynthesis C-methylase UbiE